MKKILAILLAIISLSSCEIDRDPFGQMKSDEIDKDIEGSIDGLLNGMYGQLKA